MDIINLLSEKRGLTPGEFERELGIPKASCQRLLDTLVAGGYLEFDDTNRRLILGRELTSRVFASYECDPLVTSTRVMLRRLSSKWDATFVVYEYLSDFQLVWRVKDEGANGIPTRPPGFTIDVLNSNAQGQLFLSFLPLEKLEEYCEKGLAQQVTKHSLTTFPELSARMEWIRGNGYAFQKQENSPAMKQFAVPLRFRSLHGVFALACYLPLDFKDDEGLLDTMQLEAGRFRENE
jgi:DNA-binding IclR family transcriptional regulator